MRKYLTSKNLLGLTLGVLVGFMTTATLEAQGTGSRNITSGTGFNLCPQVAAPDLPTAQGYSISLTIDGATIPTSNATWRVTGTAGQFEVLLPESQFPAAQRTIGRHNYTVVVGALLADGTIAGSTLTDFYNIVDPNGPKQGIPRWLRILGTGPVDAVKNAGKKIGQLMR